MWGRWDKTGSSPSICTVLEANGEGHTGRELAVELRFGGARTNGAPGNHCTEGMSMLMRNHNANVMESMITVTRCREKWVVSDAPSKNNIRIRWTSVSRGIGDMIQTMFHCAQAQKITGYRVQPTGNERRDVQSAMYWGEIVSSNSEPTGTPRSVRSQRSWRARWRPLLILKEPSMSGSLISPFQPTVVRGFCNEQ